MSQYDDLIAGQYLGAIKYIQTLGGLYFGIDFKTSQNPTPWNLRQGRYQGRLHGAKLDLHGYWIFRTDAEMCWQAVNGGGDGLVYWNQDGKANPAVPENWELFNVPDPHMQFR